MEQITDRMKIHQPFGGSNMHDQKSKDIAIATLTVCIVAIVLITACNMIGGCLK